MTRAAVGLLFALGTGQGAVLELAAAVRRR
jgi:hypothetical protein